MTQQSLQQQSDIIVLAGRYSVDMGPGARLGAGGMGEVFRGKDEQTGELVAVKVLNVDLTSDPSAIERFIREGEALRKLRHGNIVQMLDAIESDGRRYLIMELVSAGSLRNELERNGRLPIRRVVSVCMEIADALARVHHIDIFHRDIKPDNVLLAEDGSPRLTDFGVARFGSATRLTDANNIVGTLDYMSPEMLDGAEPTAASDLWAFGVMMFELLAGIRPFAASTPGATVGAILGQPLPDLSKIRPEIPPRLIALIERLLVKDHTTRLLSARQVGAELETILSEFPANEDEPLRPNSVPSAQRDVALAATMPRKLASASVQAQKEPLVIPTERRSHHVILNKVRRFWIDGVLRPGVAGHAPIALKYERCNEIVAHPWKDIVTDKPTQNSEVIDIYAEYEASDKALLIVGEPGGGKTYSMLTLCERLIEQAERDPWAPIPVVFNLSSWFSRRSSLADWLVEEFVSKYQLTRVLAREWLSKNELVLFLDDLDATQKTHPTACIEAINRFREEHGLMGIVVCARRNNYTAAGVPLTLGGAVFVRELDEAQIEKALASVSSENLRQALAQDAGLRQLARVPLLLRFLLEVQEKVDSDEQSLADVTQSRSSVPTTGTHRKRLLATYVDRMLARKKLGGEFSAAETKRYLGNLARKMNEHHTRMFLVEDLQPSWLATSAHKLGYLLISRAFAGAVYGVSNAIGSMIIVGPIGQKGLPLLHFLMERGGLSLAVAAFLLWIPLGLIVGVLIAFADALLFYRRDGASPPRWGIPMAAAHLFVNMGVLAALCIPFGITMLHIHGILMVSVAMLALMQPRSDPSFRNEIRPVEAFGWSWKPALWGALIGVPLSILGRLNLAGKNVNDVRLQIWVVIGFPMIFFLFGGLRGKRLDTKIRPNGGIALSLRNGLFGFVFVAGAILAMSFFLVGSSPEFLLALPNMIIIPLFFGWNSVVRHLLLRRSLATTKILPWRVVPLLEHAVSAGLMRRVGGGYMFIHALLQDYLADDARE